MENETNFLLKEIVKHLIFVRNALLATLSTLGFCYYYMEWSPKTVVILIGLEVIVFSFIDEVRLGSRLRKIRGDEE